MARTPAGEKALEPDTRSKESRRMPHGTGHASTGTRCAARGGQQGRGCTPRSRSQLLTELQGARGSDGGARGASARERGALAQGQAASKPGHPQEPLSTGRGGHGQRAREPGSVARPRGRRDVSDEKSRGVRPRVECARAWPRIERARSALKTMPQSISTAHFWLSPRPRVPPRGTTIVSEMRWSSNRMRVPLRETRDTKGNGRISRTCSFPFCGCNAHHQLEGALGDTFHLVTKLSLLVGKGASDTECVSVRL